MTDIRKGGVGEILLPGKMNRRDFIRKTSTSAFALTASVGIGPRFLRPAMAASEYGTGMTGGPTGFEGAERFQYNEGMSEGRAIEGIKKLKAEGKVPAKITMLLTDGAIGQITKPFPVGKLGDLGPYPDGAPSA